MRNRLTVANVEYVALETGRVATQHVVLAETDQLVSAKFGGFPSLFRLRNSRRQISAPKTIWRRQPSFTIMAARPFDVLQCAYSVRSRRPNFFLRQSRSGCRFTPSARTPRTALLCHAACACRVGSVAAWSRLRRLRRTALFGRAAGIGPPVGSPNSPPGQ